jgi:hypothetical protein
MNVPEIREALLLAQELDTIVDHQLGGRYPNVGVVSQEAAAELRRLHARNQELEAMLDAVCAGGDSTDEVTALPDGSAFAVYSYPLPKDHWLYASREYEQGAEEPKELAAPILTHAAREQVVSAIRYAVRGATDCGKETNFDPDALVQNAVYALCGPFNKNQPQPQADARDAERYLDYLIHNQVCVCNNIDEYEGDEDCADCGYWLEFTGSNSQRWVQIGVLGVFKNPRDAIDAAIAAAKGE